MIDVFFIVLIQKQFKAARCVYKPLFIFWQLPYFFFHVSYNRKILPEESIRLHGNQKGKNLTNSKTHCSLASNGLLIYLHCES